MALHQNGALGSGSLVLNEETDLALLDQHLLKTNTLSQRMTKILSQLDSRMSRLDRSIGPLGIRELTRQNANIDAALELLSGSAPNSGATNTAGRAPPALHITTSDTSKVSASAAPSKLNAGLPTDRLANSASPSPSVMDRGRAVSRTDAVPRWNDGAQSSPVKARASPAAAQPSASIPSPAQGTSPSVSRPGEARAIIDRGPDITSIGEYFGAIQSVVVDLEQMYKGLQEGRGGAREQGVAELSQVVEGGVGQVIQLVLQTLKDNTPRPFDPVNLASSNPPPVSTWYPAVGTLVPMTTGVAKFITPDTPTPKTSEVLTPIFGDFLDDIAAIRGDWFKRSLTSLAQKVDEVDGGGTWEGRRGEKVQLISQLWDAFLVGAEAESAFSAKLFPGGAAQVVSAKTLTNSVSVHDSTMKTAIAGIKRNLSSQNLVLLDLYSTVVAFQPRFESKIPPIIGSGGQEIENVLNGALTTLRQLALRSFPERLVDIRAPSRSNSPTTAIDDTTHSTLAYLEALPTYGLIVENLLRSSGHAERSWLMGMRDPPSSARSAADEGGMLNLFAADALGTLLIHLNQRATTMQRPISAGFLLNNVSHIRNTVLSFQADIIGPGAESMLNKSMRESRQAYMTEWNSLTALLGHQAHSRFGTASDKQSHKEAAAAFFERLTEVEALFRQYPLSRQDPELREQVGSEVEAHVRTAYQAFWTRAHNKGHDKYLRMSVDEVARRVNSLFR